MKRLVCILAAVILAISILPMCVFKARAEAPSITDPTPGYYETSEYAMGSYAVGVIFVESNGTIDPNTEDWTSTEEQNIINKIQVACNNWTAENPNANLTFTFDIHYNVSTSYEPISRNITDRHLWASQVMTNLGFSGINWEFQMRDYINALRNTQGEDWGFVIMVIDAANDADGLFADGFGAGTEASRVAIFLPVKTTYNSELIVGHEMGHVFWASDEYNHLLQYDGYLNVADVDGSGCLMDTARNWSLSGKPYGLNGTWGQVGWRDSNGNGVQDIVDTPQRVYLNPYGRIGNRVNLTGVAAVTPTENKKPWIPAYGPRRDITINKVQSVKYRIDSGEWVDASFVPTEVRELVKYPDQYAMKPTTAIVNFTFVTPELSLGQHFIEVRATNQWGISGYANQTVEILRLPRVRDYSYDPKVPWANEKVTFNATTSHSSNGNITSYQWDFGDDNITDASEPVIIHSYTEEGSYAVTLNVTDGFGMWNITSTQITVTFRTDLNRDRTVNLLDINIVATAYGSKPGDPKWNAVGDLDKNGWINIIDLTMVAKDYGKTL